MKLRKNWFYVFVLLVIASLFLAACERPLPGGYNDPDAGSDSTQPDVPETIPEVDSEAYPAEAEPAAPEEAAPADAEAPVEEGAADQGLTAEDEPVGEEAAADTGQTEEATDAEAPAEEAPEAEESAAEEEAATEETGTEGAAETPGTHTVAVGENLYRIGLLYGISWLDLAEANDIIDPANLSVGQVLTIPDAEAEEVVEAEEAPEAEASEEVAEEAEAVEESTEETAAEEVEAVEESAEEAEEGEAHADESGDVPRVYVVQQGDNLFRIGVDHGVDWTEIAAANGIVGAEIQPGQELIIPATSDSDDGADAGEAEVDEAAGEETTYVVQEGDSIYSIAFEHGIPWTALVEANNIEAPYTLEVGQTLVILIPLGE